MAYVPVMVLAVLALLSAVTLVRMIREDGRGPTPPPRSHQGDGPPRPWWTNRANPPADEHPDGPRVLLVDKDPVSRRP